MENTQVQKLHHREEGNGEGDGGGKGEEKGMHFGESDGDSDGLGDTERNNSADVNEGYSAVETAVKEVYFQSSKIKYKTEGDEGPFLAPRNLLVLINIHTHTYKYKHRKRDS